MFIAVGSPHCEVHKQVLINRDVSIFTKHPNDIGETYLQHLLQALRYSLTFLFLFFIVFIHALCPFLFQQTASDILRELNNHVNGRHTHGDPQT